MTDSISRLVKEDAKSPDLTQQMYAKDNIRIDGDAVNRARHSKRYVWRK